MSASMYSIEDLIMIAKEGIKGADVAAVSIQPQFISSSNTNPAPYDPSEDSIQLSGTVKIPFEIASKFKLNDNNLQGLFYACVHQAIMQKASVSFWNPYSATNASQAPMFIIKENHVESNFQISVRIKDVAVLATNIASTGFYKVLEEELSKE